MLEKFFTYTVGGKRPAPQLCPSQAKLAWFITITCVLQYSLNWAIKIMMQHVVNSLLTNDDTGLLNKPEKFWVMEQCSHITENTFINRLVEFIVKTSFLILLKV